MAVQTLNIHSKGKRPAFLQPKKISVYLIPAPKLILKQTTKNEQVIKTDYRRREATEVKNAWNFTSTSTCSKNTT